MNDPSTEATVIRCLLGEREAFDHLVTEWNPILTRYFAAMSSNPNRVDDLAQDTWMRVVRGLNRLRDPSRFPPWLFTLARRTFADQLRRDYREPVLEQLFDDQWAWELDDLAMVEVSELLAGLEPIDREAMVLHHLSGFPLVDIAEIAQVPVGTVKSRLYRARRQLRALMESREEERR